MWGGLKGEKEGIEKKKCIEGRGEGGSRREVGMVERKEKRKREEREMGVGGEGERVVKTRQGRSAEEGGEARPVPAGLGERGVALLIMRLRRLSVEE